MPITHTPDPTNAILDRTEYEGSNTHTGTNQHDHSDADEGGTTLAPLTTHDADADAHHAQDHSVTDTAHHDFPGGTTTFLRADGTFAAPTSTPAAHAHDALVSAHPGGMWPSSVDGSAEPARQVVGDATMYVIEFVPDVNRYCEGTLETPADWTGDLTAQIHWWGSDAVSANTVYVDDLFGRTQADNTWGNAETPNVAYTEVDVGSAGPPPTWAVNTGQGFITHTVTSQTRRVELKDAASDARDFRLTCKVSTDKSPAGAAQDTMILFRTSATGDGAGVSKYALVIRRNTAGTVTTVIRTYIANVAADVAGTSATISGVAVTDTLAVKLEVESINPTTLRYKVWTAGGAEPGSWAINTTHASGSDIENTGGYGIRSFVGAASNFPVKLGLDDLHVESLTAGAATAAKFEFRVLGYDDGDALTATWATASTVTETNVASEWQTSATISQSHPTLVGKVLQFRIGRLGADAADNIPDSILLRGLRLILDRTP